LVSSADSNARGGFFLPYQEAYLADESRLKIVEKSRRIGFTFVQSYEDVRDCIRGKGMDVWLSSADRSAAEEYIIYCEKWFKMFQAAAEYMGEVVLDEEKDIKALQIRAANGFRVNALTSNPKRFRSKGGKVVLDEYAFHDDQDAMWKAASPAITWGFPMRILSTHNGQSCRYYREVMKAKRQEGRFKLHTITIEDAVRGGLVDKILGHPSSDEERANFLAECRDIAGDEDAYLEEYMCVARDSAMAWLPWDLITSCEDDNAGRPELYQGGPVYVGRDISRRGDLAVFWASEMVGDVLWTREVVALKNAPFEEQDQVFDRMRHTYRVVRTCWDQTGMGEPIVEAGKLKYGQLLVEGVLFTPPNKQAMSTNIKQRFEDKKVRIPPSRRIRESHHSMRRMVTGTGIPSFDAERSQLTGHADDYWGHALSIEAAEAGPAVGPVHHQVAEVRRFPGKGAF
jgi:phage FluMu gp28-like protein